MSRRDFNEPLFAYSAFRLRDGAAGMKTTARRRRRWIRRIAL
jgi:hypothetical protein